MVSLESEFLGIKLINPFLLSSAPLTYKKYTVNRAFEAGWSGVVWKTIGVAIKNVSPRYAALNVNGKGIVGFGNIELISDRDIKINLKEISEIKRNWTDRAVITSIMAETNKRSWQELVKRVQDTGCDGLELNLSCPHGMSEWGMGSAVGQNPQIAKMVVEWVMEVAEIPVIAKLTPNVGSIVVPAKAVVDGGVDGISLINTVESIMGVDLDNFVPYPNVMGKSTFGGYSGSAIKPIALKMVADIGGDKEIGGIPISGIGGVSTWRDAVEFMLLGARNVQVCTAVMLNGFGIIDDLVRGVSDWMEGKGFESIDDFIGLSLKKLVNWEQLDSDHRIIAEIDQDKCIHCGICYRSCDDAEYQAISINERERFHIYKVMEDKCVGCGLCRLVCPVPDCIKLIPDN